MPALGLDHAGRPAGSRRQLVALGLLALVLAVLGGMQLADLNAEANKLEAQASRVPRQRPARAPTAAPGGGAAAALPWDRLLGALEAAASADVALLALDPVPHERHLRLDGEARDLDALRGYLRRLGASFIRVELQSHQVNGDDPQRPVRFVLLLAWGEQS
jgi:hypothetical protein